MKYIYSLLVYCFCTSLLFGQHNHTDHEEDEQCMTMEMDKRLREKFPQLGTLEGFENQLQQQISERKKLMAAGRVVDQVVTIPVVVHIIHNGEAVGQGVNISEAQVRSQIETLNEDFRRKAGTPGFNNHSKGADIEIEFQLAMINPQGQTMAEQGINRLYEQRVSWEREQIENLKTRTIWDPTLYYNIWVVNIAPSGSSQILGYAQFPIQSGLEGLAESSSANTDGVVMHVRSFGNSLKGDFPILVAPNNQGRTLTHETGHWLGLRHIWGDRNCGNDFCDDTPTQASASSGCQVGRQSCGSVNMVENYMDYSQDACMNIFTMDQKTRMRVVLNNSPRRRELLSSNILGGIIGGGPVAHFDAERQKVFLGGKVQFEDKSFNKPTQWSWVFEGGKPATSSERHPVVTYTNPGQFAVELIVYNDNGTDTISRSDFIQVLDAEPCVQVTNFTGSGVVLRDSIGYISGQNSNKSVAVSEFFENPLGYSYLSGTEMKFGAAFAKDATKSEALVTVVVWSDRGYDGSPGFVLEYKNIALQQILEDVRLNRPTKITFDREVPLSGRAFHIGYEIKYEGDSLALLTTGNEEVLTPTAWRQQSNGYWNKLIDEKGLLISHAVSAVYGMKSSVQVATSSLFVNPGGYVTLRASGAGLYNWTTANQSTIGVGPSLVVSPTQTQTYYVAGSGNDVCVDSASITVYVREALVTGVEPSIEETLAKAVVISPNPTDSKAKLLFAHALLGQGEIRVRSVDGRLVYKKPIVKAGIDFETWIDLSTYSQGVYLIELQIGDQIVTKRLVK